MITAIRTYRPQPGKAFELMTVGGVVGEISVISNYNDLDHMEELIDKAMGHAEWRAANAKVHGLCISGEARDHIFRHV
jgi:hypothetical protein